MAPRLIGKTLTADAKTLKQLTALGKIHATAEEVAAVMGVHRATLFRFYQEYPEAKEAYEAGLSVGKVSLRRIQFALAKTSHSMAIFLGKVILKQRENINIVHHDAPKNEIDTSTLSDEELATLERILEKAAGSSEAGAEGSGGEEAS